MKRWMDKAKAAWDDVENTFTGNPSEQQQSLPRQYDGAHATNASQPPSHADVARYRYHHGCNLGSVFIMERWLTNSMYPEKADGSSELTAVEGWIKQEGMHSAKERFERHWREYVSDADLDFLRDSAKANAVRLPIGYFTLGPGFCKGTDFEKVAPVYEGAWGAVKALVARCWDRGIAVLIDVHGLPGSANGQDHSGTDVKKSKFWASSKNRALATKVMAFIAQEAHEMPGVLGLQIVNESEHSAEGMYEWYDDVLRAVAAVDPSLPIYISDAWELDKALGWSMAKNSCRPTSISSANPVVVDTHLYWCFTPEDHAKSPQQIATEVHSKLHELDGRNGDVFARGGCEAFIGEYSCALNPETEAKSGGYGKEEFIRDFGWAQSERYQARACGATFWTYRMDWMDGGEWGFKQMVQTGKLKALGSLQLSREDLQRRMEAANAQRSQRRGWTVGSHVHWWDTNHPRQHYEHWRFEQGWDMGWADATQFLCIRVQDGAKGLAGGDKIGAMDLWVLKRLRETGNGIAPLGWEFELGLRQGIRDFGESAGV